MDTDGSAALVAIQLRGRPVFCWLDSASSSTTVIIVPIISNQSSSSASSPMVPVLTRPLALLVVLAAVCVKTGTGAHEAASFAGSAGRSLCEDRHDVSVR